MRGYRLLLQQPNQQDAAAAEQAVGGRGLGRGQNKMLLLLPHRMPQQPHNKLGRRGGRRGLRMQQQQQQPRMMLQQPLRMQQQPHIKLGVQVGGRGRRMLLQQPHRLLQQHPVVTATPIKKLRVNPPPRPVAF